VSIEWADDEEDSPEDLPSQPFKVWERPVAGMVYSAGVDSAEGLGHGDNACLQVVRHDTGEQVACYAQRLTPDMLGLLSYRVGHWYNGALLVVELNNHGHATIQTLRRLGYRSLYRRRTAPNQVFQRLTEELGFKTTRTSKATIISDLDEALRNGEITVREHETVVELLGFVRDEGGRMGGSPFDDRVMALALAHHGRGFLHQRVKEKPPKDDYMTGGWWRRLLSQEDSTQGKMVVGSHNRRSR
jgi:hypothetical protein